MIKRYLLSPGPTPVPERVALRMAEPMIHHRTTEFSKTFGEVRQGLRKLFQTRQDVLMLASSGTGAMEASVVNLLHPGDPVVVVNGGKFGERWLKMCQTWGMEIDEIKVEWGQAVRPDAVKEALERRPDTVAVFMQASETSTTALHPVQEIAAITRNTDTLLVVDGITAVGVLSVPMDEWGIDVLITGSQKAMMLPPGLAALALSERAWKRVEQRKIPSFYFDLQRERKAQADDTTAYTPAVSLIHGLHEVLQMFEEEGYDAVYARHDRLARATRAAVEALGLPLLAPDSPSPAATGFYVPDTVPGGNVVKYLRERMGITFAGGQDHLKGKIIRVAHIGYFGTFDIVMAVAAIEMAFRKFGANVDFGRGVGAAEEVLFTGLPEVEG